MFSSTRTYAGGKFWILSFCLKFRIRYVTQTRTCVCINVATVHFQTFFIFCGKTWLPKDISTFSNHSKCCPAGDKNSCPPDQELLGIPTKELACWLLVWVTVGFSADIYPVPPCGVLVSWLCFRFSEVSSVVSWRRASESAGQVNISPTNPSMSRLVLQFLYLLAILVLSLQ